jgi:hypothetical protein
MTSSAAVDPASPTNESEIGADSGPPTRRRPVASGLMAAALATTALGLLVGFNQLATQSPVDAILPVAAFSVGAAGVLTMIAATLDLSGSHAADRRLLDPPPVEEGFLHFGIGLAAIASVGWHWGVAAQAAIVGAYALYQLLVAELGVASLLLRRRPEPDPVRIGLTAASGVLLAAFTWAAVADAGLRPFG